MTRARDLAAFVSNADGDIKFDTDTLFIDSSANRVGIGETAPATDLHISSTANPAISIEDTDNGFAATTLQVENGGRDLDITVPQDTIFTQGSTEAMRILSNGNVGIGTAAPDTKLHVEGNLLVDAYNNAGVDGGIFLREGFLTTAQPSVTLWDMSNSGASADGLSLNANDGIRFMNGGSERMRIDNNGIVTKPNQPAFSVGVSANNWSTGTSGTLVPFDNEHVDVGNYFNTSTYKYTIPVSGRYFWSIMINRLTDSRFDLSLYRNGNRIRSLEIRQTNGSSNQWQIESASGVYNFSQNDVLDWRISAISAQGSSMIDGSGHTFDNWNMHLIG